MSKNLLSDLTASDQFARHAPTDTLLETSSSVWTMSYGGYLKPCRRVCIDRHDSTLPSARSSATLARTDGARSDTASGPGADAMLGGCVAPPTLRYGFADTAYVLSAAENGIGWRRRGGPYRSISGARRWPRWKAEAGRRWRSQPRSGSTVCAEAIAHATDRGFAMTATGRTICDPDLPATSSSLHRCACWNGPGSRYTPTDPRVARTLGERRLSP